MIAALVALVATAHSAPCADWSRCPVAATLHPVHDDLLADYQAALEAGMAGPHASPLFSGTLNEAEAHWRLLAATGRGLSLTPDDATSWRDLALSGSFLAVDRVIGDTVGRSDEAAAFREAADTMISPSAELVLPRDGHPPRLAHHTGWGVRQRFERQEEEADLDDDEAPSPPDDASLDALAPRHPLPPVKIGAALGWKLRDVDASPKAPLLTWNADLSVHNALFTLWRVDVDLFRLHWDALVRERVFDGVSVGAGLHSVDDGPDPTRWSVALSWRPKPAWVLTATRSETLDGSVERYDLALRVELGNFLPGRLSPSLAGLPAVVDSGPNRLVSPIASPTPIPLR